MTGAGEREEFAEPWPSPDPERLADAVVALAERVAEPDIRAELHALSAVIRNTGRAQATAGGSAEQAARLRDALEGGDEARVVAALRKLTAHNRAAVRPVDWSAASGG